MSTREATISREPEPGASVAAARAVNRSFMQRLPRMLWGSVKAVVGFSAVLAGYALMHTGIGWAPGALLFGVGLPITSNGVIEAVKGEAHPYIWER